MKKIQRFSKMIFYSLSEKQASFVWNLREFLEEKKGEHEIEFEFVKEYSALSERIPSDCLIVLDNDLLHSNQDRGILYNTLYKKGIPLCIPWDKLLRFFPQILKSKTVVCSGEVVLMFLPNHFKNLLRGLFRLYGFNVKTIDTASQLEQLEKQEYLHLVFDQDLSNVFRNNPRKGLLREESIQKIKKISTLNSNMSIFVVKDFQQGSLFDDITSSVKDICNLLLSYEEYLIFIKHFLHHAATNSFVSGGKKFLEDSSRWRYLGWNRLHNPKKIYSELFEDSSGLRSASMREEGTWLNLDDLLQLELNLLFVAWLDDHLAYSEESKNRASFRFIETGGEEGDAPTGISPFDSSNKSSVPFHNSKVAPQTRLILPNEPEIREGGPT